ncbi:MAG: RNA-binding cell elongation regulator Jag/EloR [Dehalococcoidales bacterium]|nr:RNA-binding cell elongation regulator Jag/EloR [Dehalococcoidales bacterium]MDZ4230192.1 RNA-binding cell elongation regulator Jag/EloR [Dehalococcoidales bacterium]
MESLEISAKTVEEAIQQALEQLGVSQEEVEITVVKEGRSGILGLGADEAVVRVTPLVPVLKGDVAEVAIDVLERLLALMDVVGSVTSQAQPAPEAEKETTSSLVFNIHGDDLGVLIGRRGHTLSCLQYIVRLVVGHQTKNWVPIAIDVEGYKQRRYQTLQAFARQMAEQVRTRQTPFAFEPMPPDERRLIHLSLADHPDIVTESIGEGESRRVVISCKRNET